MEFYISVPGLINLVIIASGIGICALNLIQVSLSKHLKKPLVRSFQLFFSLIILYMGSHMVRLLLEGRGGDGIRTVLESFTFIEFTTTGFMALTMSGMLLLTAKKEKPRKVLQAVLLALLAAHAVMLFFNLFEGEIYYFGKYNFYHRGRFYLLSNICPVGMLVIDAYILIVYRESYSRRVSSAFWLYIIAPVAAIIVQSFAYGIQFIMLSSSCAAVYMFSVIAGEQNKDYVKHRREKERMETELSLATRIQADMLPNIFPAFPDRKEFDIYASMKPAKEVGGDFYDFFFVDDRHLALVIADVSDKGVPAALMMMVSKIITQNLTMTHFNPAATMAAVNTQIGVNNKHGMFVTMWLGILDLKTGRLTASNAGHEYPVLKKSGGEFELFKDKHSFVLGAMEETKYQEYEILLEKGSVLFVYTDGVVEASDAKKKMFGTKGLLDALNGKKDEDPEKIIKNVEKSLEGFVKKADRFDDFTMLCLKYNGWTEE